MLRWLGLRCNIAMNWRLLFPDAPAAVAKPRVPCLDFALPTETSEAVAADGDSISSSNSSSSSDSGSEAPWMAEDIAQDALDDVMGDNVDVLPDPTEKESEQDFLRALNI